MATFADTPLCNQQDIEREIGPLNAITLSSSTDLASIVNDAITGGHRDITMDLRQELPSMFVTSLEYYPGFPYDYAGWIDFLGVDYSQLSTLLDYIGNPEVLLDAATAASIYRLYNRLASSMATRYGESDKAFNVERDNWRILAKQRLEKAKIDLWLDLNSDGKVSKTELVRTHTGFRRS